MSLEKLVAQFFGILNTSPISVAQICSFKVAIFPRPECSKKFQQKHLPKCNPQRLVLYEFDSMCTVKAFETNEKYITKNNTAKIHNF